MHGAVHLRRRNLPKFFEYGEGYRESGKKVALTNSGVPSNGESNFGQYPQSGSAVVFVGLDQPSVNPRLESQLGVAKNGRQKRKAGQRRRAFPNLLLPRRSLYSRAPGLDRFRLGFVATQRARKTKTKEETL